VDAEGPARQRDKPRSPEPKSVNSRALFPTYDLRMRKIFGLLSSLGVVNLREVLKLSDLRQGGGVKKILIARAFIFLMRKGEKGDVGELNMLIRDYAACPCLEDFLEKPMNQHREWPSPPERTAPTSILKS